MQTKIKTELLRAGSTVKTMCPVCGSLGIAVEEQITFCLRELKGTAAAQGLAEV